MAPPAGKASPDPAAREALLGWFRAEGPAYPWRSDPSPYVVLVSEFMLQQTQAPRVAEALPAFLGRFPDVRALARATPADVIRAWQGLGYNRRAVRLHQAARAIVERHDGRVPDDPKELLDLPGVGPYTAAAVASIAYGIPVAAIDTNVRRVVARLALGGEPGELAKRDIEHAADAWVAREDPGAWNQAVMDLGRFVCRSVPRCEACPLERSCRYVGGDRARAVASRGGERFEGSRRQLRGRIVSELRSAPSVDVTDLARELGRPEGEMRAVVDGLERDGLVETLGRGRIRLPVAP